MQLLVGHRDVVDCAVPLSLSLCISIYIVGIYSRADACMCTLVPGSSAHPNTQKPVDDTARSFPPVSSSMSAWLICSSFCLLLSCDVCDVLMYHPSEGGV